MVANTRGTESTRTPPTPDHPMPASEAAPIYRKVKHTNQRAGVFWYITCHTGRRQRFVCAEMDEHVADWLLGVLGRQPFAPEARRVPMTPDAPVNPYSPKE